MFKFYDFMEGAGGDFHNTRFAESPKRENPADWFEPVAMQKIKRSKCKNRTIELSQRGRR
jgi:hypothetical protein